MKREPRIINRRFLALLLLFIGVGGFAVYGWLGAPDAQLNMEGGPLRLHILANSDDVQDQQLKLALRDHVIGLVKESMGNAADKQEAMTLIKDSLPQLTIACNEFLAPRASYSARLELTTSQFPEIDYGEFTLPAGEYDALRIVLGEGAGHNWWCVLFPPLCFVDLAGEAQAVAPASSGAPAQDTVEVRYKLTEWLEQ